MSFKTLGGCHLIWFMYMCTHTDKLSSLYNYLVVNQWTVRIAC